MRPCMTTSPVVTETGKAPITIKRQGISVELMCETEIQPKDDQL